MVKSSMDHTKIHIAVLMGGFSSEREVSLNSGRRVTEALQGLGCSVQEVDVQDECFSLPNGTDLAFIALHGTGGEDGVVQSILEKKGVLFTGSGSEASRLAFDKVESKKIFRKIGLATPKDIVCYKKEFGKHSFKLPFDYPCVVKPSREGSSIGVQIVQKSDQIQSAILEAFKRDDTVLVEEFIAGRELTVGILGNRALPVVEIRPRSGWFDYHNKYTEGATDELVPAPVESAIAEQSQSQALMAHRAMNCLDLSRADFRLDEGGKTYILEVNTIPGMTATSLLPKASAAAGIPFPQLCLSLIESAWERREHR